MNKMLVNTGDSVAQIAKHRSILLCILAFFSSVVLSAQTEAERAASDKKAYETTVNKSLLERLPTEAHKKYILKLDYFTHRMLSLLLTSINNAGLGDENTRRLNTYIQSLLGSIPYDETITAACRYAFKSFETSFNEKIKSASLQSEENIRRGMNQPEVDAALLQLKIQALKNSLPEFNKIYTPARKDVNRADQSHASGYTLIRLPEEFTQGENILRFARGEMKFLDSIGALQRRNY